jgi:23S rRNA (cytosine1962-C5)-methyltransferase
VLSVDASAPTLAVAARNMAHNRRNAAVAACAHTSEVGDAFEVLDRFVRQHRRYDLVVLDPPSFAQRAANVPRALHAYAQLTERGVRLLEPGGLLVQGSCSSRVTADEFAATVRGAAGRIDYLLDVIRETGHPVDHPVTFAQGAYLKAMFARVRPR